MKLDVIVKDNIVLTFEQLLADPELLKEAQTLLAKLNWYPPHAIDGKPGPLTKEAMKSFCKANHLDNFDSGRYGATFAKTLLEAKSSLQPVTKEDHIRLILDECKKQGIGDRNQISYIIATVQHETAGKFQPIDEIGGLKYLSRYEGRKDLGNNKSGDGVKFAGRGYVQITGRINYTKYAKLTGLDLVNHPELVKEPSTAAFILVHGFKTGTFTGKKISDYINSKACNFYSCRRCINGVDQAQLIASYAENWLTKLKAYGV